VLNARLKLNEMAASKSVDDLLQVLLDEVERLTGSSIGFFHFLEPDQETLSLQMWSTNTLNRMCTAEGKNMHYPVNQAGVWADAVRERCPVIHNDYRSLPHKKGMPEGHAEVVRELVIPISREGKIQAILGVGNKKNDYTGEDTRILVELADLAWDIVLKKQAEEALKTSEEKYRLLAENITDTIWTLQLCNQRFSYVSPSAERLLGYRVAEMLELEPLDYLTPESMIRWSRAISQALEKQKQGIFDPEQSIILQLEQIKKDGRKIWTEVTARFLLDKSGQADRILGITRDITARKQLESRLQQAQKMEAIGTLAGGIAHDFNNILGVIFGYAELCLMDAPIDSPTYNHLKEIYTASERARSLVKQILNFSRQSDQELQPLQLTSVIKEVLKFIRASLPASIEIRQNLISDPTMLADITQIHQVIMNLCSNAAQSMQENGGTLEIRLESMELDTEFTARHAGLQPGVHVKLTVSDTGCGIPGDVMDRIFDPFFTTKSEGEGTGMGLAVVHGIVKNHGGIITVYSEPEKGSVFTVFFPAIERRLVHDPRPEKPLVGGTESILFVDDEAPLVELGKTILAPFGYQVTGVKRSIEALELFEKEPRRFDLVITDLTMPQISGDRLAQRFLEINPEIPIILCTGFSASIDREHAATMGIRAFVNKPILRRQLVETVRTVLDS